MQFALSINFQLEQELASQSLLLLQCPPQLIVHRRTLNLPLPSIYPPFQSTTGHPRMRAICIPTASAYFAKIVDTTASA
jgi:hypothetical protein